MKRIGLLVLILVVMVGCKNNELVNGNGYDNSIVVEEDVIEQAAKISYRKQKVKKGINSYESNFKEFVGIETVFIINGKVGSEFKLNYEAKVDKGRIALVAVRGNEVIYLSQGELKGEYSLSLGESEMRIKFVGDNTSGRINFDIEEVEGLEVEVVDVKGYFEENNKYSGNSIGADGSIS